jgi:hypothetical protein
MTAPLDAEATMVSTRTTSSSGRYPTCQGLPTSACHGLHLHPNRAPLPARALPHLWWHRAEVLPRGQVAMRPAAQCKRAVSVTAPSPPSVARHVPVRDRMNLPAALDARIQVARDHALP